MRIFAAGFLILGLAATVLPATASATILYTYDFPGSPGSGLAGSQSNGQPANATFGDFTRTGGLTQVTGGMSTDAFDTQNWNQTGFINLSQYEGFSITASAGYHLDLTDLAFQVKTSATGVSNGRVALFINGSTTAYATFNYTPTTTLTTQTFNFTDLVDADNATSVEFRFYGWNAGGAGSQLVLDNVASSGVISNVPEFEPAWLGLLVIAASLVAERRRAKTRTKRDPDVTAKTSRFLTDHR